ncbi:MAG: GNAT family N-acetyltransferase [Ferruginibacter sp.]
MSEPVITWSCKKFTALTAPELYTILRLRSEVFVVEQNCVYLDPDGKDAKALHLCGWLNNEHLVAYARLLPPGISYSEASIGRVVTAAAHRKDGYGRILMRKAVENCLSLFGPSNIRIGAQQYLVKFYSEFGFQAVSEPYLEDGIPHVEMLLNN